MARGPSVLCITQSGISWKVFVFSVGKTFFHPWLEVLKKFKFCMIHKNAPRNSCPFQRGYIPDTISVSHVLKASAYLRAITVCWSGKIPVCFCRTSVLRKHGNTWVKTVWNKQTTLLSQGKKITSVCGLIICGDENFLQFSYFKTSLVKTLKGNKLALAKVW